MILKVYSIESQKIHKATKRIINLTFVIVLKKTFLISQEHKNSNTSCVKFKEHVVFISVSHITLTTHRSCKY